MHLQPLPRCGQQRLYQGGFAQTAVTHHQHLQQEQRASDTRVSNQF
jgi:hypothetical protein